MDPELASMRREYAARGLDESDAGEDPVTLFERWFDDAVTAGLPEPNAMALATADPSGAPSVRIVLLKGWSAQGVTFFTGYESRKGAELATNPHAAGVMLWHPLQRQVRFEGSVTRVEAAESDAYFASRPRGAQVSAAASRQSQVVSSRTELERRVGELENSSGGGQVARPESWGGYCISLEVVEFWQGRENRLHDRIRFTRQGDGWDRDRLAP